MSGEAKVKVKPQSKYKYAPQYGVVVIVRSEAEQKQVYEDLLNQGYVLKVVCV